MKRLEKFKKLAKAVWQQLNDKEIAAIERDEDVSTFNAFVDKLIIVVYAIFGIFSFISLSLFITRVIL